MCRSKAQGGRRCPSSQKKSPSLSVSHAASHPSFDLNQVPSWLREGITVEAAIPSNIRGLVKQEISGKIVDYGYVNKTQLSGKINPTQLTSDSYKEFGFIDPHERQSEAYYEGKYEDDASENQEFALAEEANNATIANNPAAADALNEYTGLHWCRLVNEALSDGDIESLSVENQAKVNLINEAAQESLHVQRTVYRGLRFPEEDYDYYMSEMNLGQEIVVDGFQSTSMSRLISRTFSLGNSQDKSVMLEIMTPQGFNISEQSQYPTEQEVILPHHSRYMVVGKHISEDDEGEFTTIQIVAINDDAVIKN